MAPAPARYRRLVLALLGFEALLVLGFALGTGAQGAVVALTGISNGALHLIAFGLAAALAGSAYRPLPVALLLLLFAALIEFGQLFIDGREASFSDIAVGGLGIAAGLALAQGLALLVQRTAR